MVRKAGREGIVHDSRLSPTTYLNRVIIGLVSTDRLDIAAAKGGAVDIHTPHSASIDSLVVRERAASVVIGTVDMAVAEGRAPNDKTRVVP